jgi:hypothetical protein
MEIQRYECVVGEMNLNLLDFACIYRLYYYYYYYQYYYSYHYYLPLCGKDKFYGSKSRRRRTIIIYVDI